MKESNIARWLLAKGLNPMQVCAFMLIVDSDKDVSGQELATWLGCSRSYGIKIKRDLDDLNLMEEYYEEFKQDNNSPFAGSRVRHPRRKWDTYEPGEGVASDKLFHAGETPTPPGDSPYPLTEGDSAQVPPLKGDKGGFTEVDSPYPLSEGDIKGGGTEGDSKDSKDFKPLKPF